MPIAVLTILKFCLVALIFLFLARVLRAVWAQINGPLEFERTSLPDTASGATPAPSKQRGRKRTNERQAPTVLVIEEPAQRRGTEYPLTMEMTVGRAPGCAIVIEDSFASQLHARVFQRTDGWFVEDLGSRNGTWLNRDQVHGPQRLELGDRIRVGDTVLEAQ
jgi:hypothetical protein